MALPEPLKFEDVDRKGNYKTWIIIFCVYSLYFLLTWFHAKIPDLVLFPLGAICLAWFGSLQHELIHGHPSRFAFLNFALGFPPLNPFLPFSIYKESHLKHHKADPLTAPTQDTESYYIDPESFDRSNLFEKKFWIFYQTFVGRMLFGPLISTFQFFRKEIKNLLKEPKRFLTWFFHLLGCISLFFYLDFIQLGFIKYLLFFVYPGTSISMLRSFAEHRPRANPVEQSILIEANPFFRILYLENNLHLVHHHQQHEPWHRLRPIFHEHREDYINASNGFYYKGYFQIIFKFFLTPRDNPRFEQSHFEIEGE